MGVMWSDVLAGQTAAFAILAALHHRRCTGEGQYIDCAMSEATLAVMPEAVMNYTMNGRVREGEGNCDESMAPHGCYPCRGEDAWVAVAIGTDEQWLALCRVMGDPVWAREARFADGLGRWHNQEEIDRHVAAWTAGFTPREVMAMLQEAGIPAGPSCSVTDLLADPHLRERDFFWEMDHPEMGKAALARLPWRTGGEPAGRYAPSPLLGEHNDYVFRTLLGLTGEELACLEAEKVVY